MLRRCSTTWTRRRGVEGTAGCRQETMGGGGLLCSRRAVSAESIGGSLRERRRAVMSSSCFVMVCCDRPSAATGSTRAEWLR